MKKKELQKLREGEELIFSDGKTLMEKVIVESIDKKAGFAILNNRVKISRTIGPDGSYSRLDGKEIQRVFPLTEESQLAFEAFKAYFSLKRNLEILGTKIKDFKDQGKNQEILEINNKLNKIINKYFE